MAAGEMSEDQYAIFLWTTLALLARHSAALHLYGLAPSPAAVGGWSQGLFGTAQYLCLGQAEPRHGQFLPLSARVRGGVQAWQCSPPPQRHARQPRAQPVERVDVSKPSGVRTRGRGRKTRRLLRTDGSIATLGRARVVYTRGKVGEAFAVTPVQIMLSLGAILAQLNIRTGRGALQGGMV
jgi:hypothetical protein